MLFRIFSLAAVAVLPLFSGPLYAEQAHQLYGPFQLTGGQTIKTGILSLVMQTDGNFVLYKDGVGAVWHTGTYGRDCSSGCTAAFQGDGNLVLYKNGVPFAYTSTFGQGLQLKLSQGPPYLSIVSGDSTIWAAQNVFASLLIRSGHTARLPGANVAMQTDGNLVVSAGSTVVWHTGTQRNCGVGNCFAVFQDDGNLVLYDRGVPYWYTGTNGTGLLLRILPSTPSVSIFSSGTMIWPRATPTTPPPQQEPLNCWGQPIRIYGACG